MEAWQPPFELPEPGPEPRPKPGDAESAAITGHLRELAATLLDSEQVKLVIGHTPGSLPGQMVPAFVRSGQETGVLAWNDRCAGNLAVYLPEMVKQAGGRVAVVVKSCDARAVAGLLRENQVRPEDAVLLGVECAGIWHEDRLAARCHSCAEAVSPLADWTLTASGAVEGSVPPQTERATGPDPRSAQLAVLEARPAAERWEFWQREFDRCIRCYACRAVCPLCYCQTCIAEKHSPQWISTAIEGPGNLAWNVTRAMHLAGRCIDCDECARACPADIRLDLLNRAVAGEIADRFGYQTGSDPGLPAPLTTFHPDDPDGFQ
ncbi:MAG TPA: (Fe-S)-binding protein [Streptosporangiaceae bacterium]|nr:(Fe-S)-binding protein [Streptosporangiaceae bacterium]